MTAHLSPIDHFRCLTANLFGADLDDWEDVQIKQMPAEAAAGSGADVQPVGDADEWEDV